MGCFDNLRRKPNPVKPEPGFYKRSPAASIGWYLTPRVVGPDDYPLDVDASERFVRPKRGIDFFPCPNVEILADTGSAFMGAIDGTMPMDDRAMVAIAQRKRATPGPMLYGAAMAGPGFYGLMDVPLPEAVQLG